MSSIFLGHLRANNSQAIALRDRLVVRGWQEQFRDFDPGHRSATGARWVEALHEAACRRELVLAGKAGLGLRWCMKERNLAHLLQISASSNSTVVSIPFGTAEFANIPKLTFRTSVSVDLTARAAMVAALKRKAT